jgi:hypothetical protein
MQIQLSANETSYSPLFGTSLHFETDPNTIDPPEGQGGGGTAPSTPAPQPPADEEPSGQGS